MRVVVRSPAKPDPIDLRLLPAETSRWDDLGANVVALLSRATGQQRDSHPVFNVISQPAWKPERSMTASLFVHAAAAFLLLNVTSLVHFAERDKPLDRATLDTHRIQYYNLADALPAISNASNEEKPAQEKGGRHRRPAKIGATVQRVQKVISNPPAPDNKEQTIFQPDAPTIKIAKTQPLPNIVMWSDAAKPAPPVDLVSRQLSSIRTADFQRPAVDIPAPEVQTTPSALPLAPDAPAPPPPPDPTLGAGDAEARLRKLVVINASPVAASGPIDVATGNRAGAFSAGPAGRGGGTPNGAASGSETGGVGGPAPAGDGTAGGKRDAGGIRVPGLAVTGGVAAPRGPVVSGPPVARAPLPSTPSRSAPDPRLPLPGVPKLPTQLPAWNASRDQPELGFTPGKRVYTVYINMPNLASGGGGSWVLRFAELVMRPPGEQIDITSPTALRKIDPGYARDAVREKIEGQVKLHAIIRRDGKVERAEVLKSLDPRLDQRAIDAFLRWEFTPALRQGVPVDLEAVIEIPFKLPITYP